jgi:cell division protein FtsN
MKTKIILALAVAVFLGVSCKSKQKLVTIDGANKPAETAITSPVIVEETVSSQEVTRNETFQIVLGDDAAAAKKYHVVVGSFKNYDNAKRLQAELTGEGYSALIARNEQEMYRVIISSFNEYNQARSLISSIKSRFSDAWVLIQKK